MDKKIYKAISRFKKMELEEARREKQHKKRQVCIDPDSIIAKEIKYQTALLHEILNAVRGGNASS